MERAVEPLLFGLLVPAALLAVAGVVRAAREPSLHGYGPDEQADYNEATRRFM